MTPHYGAGRALPRARFAAVALAVVLAAPARAAEPELAPGEHRALVQANCTPCHSVRLVTQNRGTREDWLEMIRWMQRTQGLWPFPPSVEAQILDYLAEHYGRDARPRRRAPLPPELRPPDE